MRITRFRAINLLSFEDLDLDLTYSPFTILVGPNGAGKTNVFRLIRVLIEGAIVIGTTGNQAKANEWVAVLDTWKRSRNSAANIEIDIEWTDASEGWLIANFLQMVLSNPEDIANALSEPAHTLPSQPGWPSFVEALMCAITDESIMSQWSGTLGCRYVGPFESVFYFRPSVAKNAWVWMLGPYSGIVSEIPELPISSHTSSSLVSIWVESLPTKTRETLKQVLKGEAPPDSLSLSVNWPDIWTSFQSTAQKRSGICVLNGDLRHLDRGKPHPHYRDVLRELGLAPYGQEFPTLFRVLTHLLNRCVISEDLLSPPALNYPATTWWNQAKTLTSEHLSAYMLALKNGQDVDRKRFTRIQQTFKNLTGRDLDVITERVIGTNGNAESEELFITLIQSDLNVPHSVPLSYSGSGLVEMAYLSAVLNSPNSHVIMLDEPGRSLHPQALIKLRWLLHQRAAEPSAPQMLVITHSPYLVPPSAPHCVRRVRRATNGCTEVARLNVPPPPTSGKARQELERRNLERQDRWGRSPNWPKLLFSTVVLLVDGETELGALPEWYERIYQEPIEALGASVLSVGGKANGGAAIQDLDNLGISWVGLIDGDSLKTGAGAGSGNIWAELEKSGRITNQEANRFRCSPLTDQVERLQEYAIYVLGQTPEDDFETVLKSENPEIEIPPNLGGSKVIRGRWWARNVPCPRIVQRVFDRIRKVADFQSGNFLP